MVPNRIHHAGPLPMLKRFLVAGAFVVGTTLAAAAADLPSPPPVAPAAPPPPMASPAFDWSGPYIGVYGSFLANFAGPAYGVGAGVQAGFNIQRGSFVVGLELQAGVIYDITFGAFGFDPQLNARLGFAVGERALVYAEGGAGAIIASGVGTTPFWTAGGGLAFAIRDPMTAFGEVKVLAPFGGGGMIYIFQAGLNWHR